MKNLSLSVIRKRSLVARKPRLITTLITPKLKITSLQRIVMNLLGIHQIMVTKMIVNTSNLIGGEGGGVIETGIIGASIIEVGIIVVDLIIEEDMAVEEASITIPMDTMDMVMVKASQLFGNDPSKAITVSSGFLLFGSLAIMKS